MVLIAKKTWEWFPVYFAYAASSFVFSIAEYTFAVVSPSKIAYFNAFWINEASGLLLGLGVVFEIFRHLFTPYPALRKLATIIFQSAVVLLISLGVFVVYSQPLGANRPITSAFLAVDEGTRILQVGLILALFLFARAFGLQWRQYVFGIALGLGIFATVELVVVTVRVQFGISTNSIVSIARTISFISSLFIWIAYLLAPELSAEPAEMPKRAQLEQWNQAVMELIYQ